MKTFPILFCAAILAVVSVGCAPQPKTYQVNLMYNKDTGYSWYLDNADSLEMVKLISEKQTPGAFIETKLGNPYTQTFIFKLVNPAIGTETAVFKYKHHLEKDEPHAEAEKQIELKAINFK